MFLSAFCTCVGSSMGELTGNLADTAGLGGTATAEHVGGGETVNRAVVFHSADALSSLVG
jgi:hypothetical protein